MWSTELVFFTEILQIHLAGASRQRPWSSVIKAGAVLMWQANTASQFALNLCFRGGPLISHPRGSFWHEKTRGRRKEGEIRPRLGDLCCATIINDPGAKIDPQATAIRLVQLLKPSKQPCFWNWVVCKGHKPFVMICCIAANMQAEIQRTVVVFPKKHLYIFHQSVKMIEQIYAWRACQHGAHLSCNKL